MVASGCSNDPPTRAEFVDQMIANSATANDVPESKDRWTETWGCVYDKLDGGESIDRLMDQERGEPVPQDLSASVSKVILECSPVTTLPVPTTVPGSPSTTLPGSGPTTTAPT